MIFEVMYNLFEQGEAIDLVTVTSALTSTGSLEQVGGVTYLTNIAGSVPTAANIEYYSKIVEEKAILRRLIQTASNIVTSTFTKEEDRKSTRLNSSHVAISYAV